MQFVLLYYCLLQRATVRACHMPCCPVFCHFIVLLLFLNEINGDGDGEA